MRCELAGPEAEAVMVLGGDDDALESCFAEERAPLVAIEFGRIENSGTFLSIAPFTSGERIDGKVNEIVHAQTLPGELTR